jgi:hypothetical protein
MHYFEREIEVMEADLPLFERDIEFCRIPRDFLLTPFRR